MWKWNWLDQMINHENAGTMKRRLCIIICLLQCLIVKSQSLYQCRYWFDQEPVQTVAVAFAGYTAQMELDAGSLTEGLHTLCIHVMDTSGVWGAPQSYLFYRMHDQINSADVIYHCWFDQDVEHEQTGPFGTGQFLLDADKLTSGLHTLNVALEGEGLSSTQCYMFYKVPDPINPSNPENVIYHCWFDEDFAHEQTGQFGTGHILLNTRGLDEGEHMVHILLEGEGLTSTQSYTFEKHFINGRDIITIVNPTMFAGTLEGAGRYDQGDTCTLTATPNEIFSFVNWTHDGNVVSDSTEYNFVITEDATYEANFNWANPASTDYIADGLVMYLDGICNTRNGHDSTATVWEDLIGNHDLTVTGYSSYTWEGNHFYGAGNGGYLNSGKTWKYFNALNDDLTIEIVTYIDCDRTSPSWRGLAGWHVNSDGTNIQNDQGSSRMQTLGGLPVAEADDMIATVSYTKDNGSFLNGQWRVSINGIPNGVNSNQIVVFGNSHAQMRGWNDSIYCIRMYNRSLTPEEVAYNHNIDVERFGASSSVWYGIVATANPSNGGTITGAGSYEEGEQCTLTATANPNYTFINWTENNYQVSADPIYCFTVTGYRSLVANFVQNQPNSYIISTTVQPIEGGTVSGGGGYAVGSTCTLSAIPAEGYFFHNWTKNGVVVSNRPTISFTVNGNANYIANFMNGLPELHVTGITHSDLIAGQQATVSWTVQNDGIAATPNGEIWHDRVWLSVESRVAADDNNPILLGTFDNLSALDVGEYYTQTQTFNIPIDIVGEYYLFVLTDAYDCHTIYWDSTGVQLPYNPPPYLGGLAHHCNSGCPNVADNRIYELSEFEHGDAPGSYYHDNFFYTVIDIAVPLVPDLQVTSVIPPDNFFSGTDVNVTAMICNLGEVTTLPSAWTDALYVSSTPDFNTATCIATRYHSGALPVGNSYQVTFTGHIPLTMYGETYFFVYTDCYEQVYEHVLNHNNVMMSGAVNMILTPPADLVPAEVVVPSEVSTAESFSYSFKVYNNGAGNPNVSNWQDKVYLSQNAETIGENAMLLKTHYHYGGLASGANYSVSESLVLPSSVSSGTYYLYVVADANDEVFEYLYDNNNGVRSSQIAVTAPDLQVTQLSASEQITSGYPLNLSYTLTNQGTGAIVNKSVTDKIFVSASGTMTDAIRIDSLRRNVYLAAGQSMTVMRNEIVPAGLSDGTYYLLVVTDYYNDVNESDENNNTYSHYPMAVLHQPLPDLQPVSLNLPSVIQAGEVVNVDFDIANNCDMALLNSNCAFDVYAVMGEEEILCPVQSQTLPLGNYVSIGVNETLHFVRTILVPASVTSACTNFELVADKDNAVPELDENNNALTLTATVLDSPLSDLTVSNVVLPALQAGAEAQVSFTVNNNGLTDFSGTFGTTVYAVSETDTVLCSVVQQLAPESGDYSIAVGASLTFTQTLLVPPTVTASHTTFSVLVDEANEVLEANENNNTANVNVTVTAYPFNLTTQNVTVPSAVTAGEATTVSWMVMNTGTCPNEQISFYVKNENGYALVGGETLSTPWKDVVFLSDDAVLGANDVQLLAVDHNTVVHPNGTYSVEPTITLPYNAVGSKYLLCVSDATQLTFDNNRSDNIVAVPVEVEMGLLPDLRITSLDVEPVMTADNTYWVHYTVANEGERATQRDNWTDAFYISETQTVTNAFLMGSKIHNGVLEVGESYTDSIEILAPYGLEGDYYLLGYTDVTNQIYENTNETNNLLGVAVTVVSSDPCDLIAVQPEFPTSVVSGEDMTVSWQLRNIGSNPAIGRIRNAVYLSADATWSSDDMMLGYADINVNIAGNGQQACSLSGTLTGIAEGDYYVIVKANILNALNESSYENNTCISLLTTEVNFPLLVIGDEVNLTMAADQFIYYKMEVGPELDGQTLSCRLTTTAQQVANGIYLSHGIVPTLAQFDYGQYLPFAQEIELLIPKLEQGSYYLLAKGATQSGTPQQINIATSIISFEILSIDADHGSNTGSITTKVTGAKFDSIMDFRLVQGSEYLPAEKVFFSNSTQTFTTFDLVDMPAGTYDMIAELPGGIITIKGDAFTIEEGLPAELAINIVAPASVRSGNTFVVNIEYGNIGTTDLNVSGFVVVSRNGHPMGFTTEALEEGLTELSFDSGETNGNPDVMRPDYRGTKAILVKATPSTDISLAVYAIRRQY